MTLFTIWLFNKLILFDIYIVCKTGISQGFRENSNIHYVTVNVIILVCLRADFESACKAFLQVF
jgi:hypothetical protein